MENANETSDASINNSSEESSGIGLSYFVTLKFIVAIYKPSWHVKCLSLKIGLLYINTTRHVNHAILTNIHVLV